jgi:transposase
MKRIDYNQLARGLVIRWIQRYKERYILEEDLIGGEDKRKIVEEIDKIIEQIKEDKFYKRKAEQLQWKLDAYERLQDCNEEFEL